MSRTREIWVYGKFDLLSALGIFVEIDNWQFPERFGATFMVIAPALYDTADGMPEINKFCNVYLVMVLFDYLYLDV